MRFSRSKGYSIGCESEKIPKIRFSRCYLIHDYLSSIIGKYLAHVLSTSSKNKKVLIFSYISGNETFWLWYLKISYIFLYFQKRKPWKSFFMFQETEILEIFLCFKKMKLSGFDLKKFLIFSQKKAFLIFRNSKYKLFLYSRFERCSWRTRFAKKTKGNNNFK